MILEGLVSVVVINYNSGDFIFKCLEHVKKQTYPHIEILVIDNNSQDGSGQRLDELSKNQDIAYFHYGENMGSSRANNIGIEKSQGEYILILNADVFLENDYVEKCVKGFGKDLAIGTVVGKFLSAREKSIIDSAGIILFKEGVGNERGSGEKDHGQYDKEEFIVGACCAAVMYKRKMLQAIRYRREYYDEDFFAFVEDLDLSVRSILLGWKTYYCPSAVAYHVRGGSVKPNNRFIAYLNYRNHEYFYLKTYRTVDVSSWISRKVLKIIRIITIKKSFKTQCRKEMRKVEKRLLEKRLYFSPRCHERYLKPYLRKSYIISNFKHRIMRRIIMPQ